MSEHIMHGSSDDWNKMDPQFRTRLLSELTRIKAEVQTLRHQAVHDVSQLGEQSAEIAHLKAENEELHKDYEALADEHTKLIDRNARLQAEVERLRKAGDELSASLTIHSNHPNCGARDEWLRAKKGLPSLAEQWEREKNNNNRAAQEGKPSA